MEKTFLIAVFILEAPPKTEDPFRKGTGRGHYRLSEVPGKVSPMVSTTPLGTVTVGQTIMNTQGGIHSPKRLAGFGRIN